MLEFKLTQNFESIWIAYDSVAYVKRATIEMWNIMVHFPIAGQTAIGLKGVTNEIAVWGEPWEVIYKLQGGT